MEEGVDVTDQDRNVLLPVYRAHRAVARVSEAAPLITTIGLRRRRVRWIAAERRV